MSIKKEELKQEILIPLNMLKMALEDDILTEKAGIKLYTIHINTFKKYFNLDNPELLVKKLEKLGIKRSKTMASMINNFITEKQKPYEKHKPSIQHILDEEIEHVKELEMIKESISAMIEGIENI
jgi:hypothetical protein